MSNRFLFAALAHARRGWRVFPLRPNTKIPALPDWERVATTDPERIHQWWRGRPWNVGVAVGPSGLFVIDFDAPKECGSPRVRSSATSATSAINPVNRVAVSESATSQTATPRHGRDVFVDLCQRHGQPIPARTLIVATPSGGWHLYFQHPDGPRLRNTKGGTARSLGEYVDTRAHGGYVVAPGSAFQGHAYTIVRDVEPIPLPDWLTQLLHETDRESRVPPPNRPTRVPLSSVDRRSRFLESAVTREVDHVRQAPASTGNAILWGASVALGQLVAGGELDESTVTDLLEQAATLNGRRSPTEARATIRSGLRRGAQRPRRVA